MMEAIVRLTANTLPSFGGEDCDTHTKYTFHIHLRSHMCVYDERFLKEFVTRCDYNEEPRFTIAQSNHDELTTVGGGSDG